MPLSVQCPKCKKSLRVNDTLMGKKIRCPGCQGVVPVGGGARTAARPGERRAESAPAAAAAARAESRPDRPGRPWTRMRRPRVGAATAPRGC